MRLLESLKLTCVYSGQIKIVDPARAFLKNNLYKV
ncbi:hypothetical protein JOC47_002347 [Halanaerobacter jeridensis]|uniref:Uncharacterized protein n=1 Tax=Halanaerobacter jeridensis TaxID=706427 RepID=A0A939BST4_9FIRM|nr:hypothetical protein [Halanaerobacter jeridensis]